VLALYRLTTYVILEKTKHKIRGESHSVDGCLVITSAAVYEIRPRLVIRSIIDSGRSREVYFL
jgi:hypothetical protein